MPGKVIAPTDAEILNSGRAVEGDSKISFNGEFQAEENRIKALLCNATEAEKLRLFAESIIPALSTSAFNYAPFLSKEEFNSLYCRATAAVLIKEDLNSLRILNYKLISTFDNLYIFMGDFQSAAYYIAAVRAYNTALEGLKINKGIDLPPKENKALKNDILAYSSLISEFIIKEEGGNLRLNVQKGIDRLTSLISQYRELQREAKTRLSAISDTIEVLEISDIIDKQIKKTIANIENNLATIDRKILNYSRGILILDNSASGENLNDPEEGIIYPEYKEAYKALKKAPVPYSRTHAFTKEYKDYVTGYFQGKPGDKGLGDKILKEIEIYKRKK